jgi:hypothetical protein
VYRDPGDPAPSSSSRRSAADDSAYWYDLLAEDPVPQHEEARGPFEPLQPSTQAGAEEPQEAQESQEAPEPPDAVRDGRQEAPEQARARKLEQLKDLYLTAEAIGEQNVDKHFDQLLAQQRELISGYFKQPSAVQPDVTGPRDGRAADAEPGHQQTGHQQTGHQQTGHQQTEYQQTGAADGPVTPPEGVSVRAEPPRAW